MPMESYSVGIPLVMAGSAVFIIGVIVVLLTLTYVRKIKIEPDTGVINCDEPSVLDRRPFAILSHNVRSPEAMTLSEFCT